ncbi:MAG TPA: YicC family protein [Bacteroidetes bacterium]|nr:YicC family protein [Bacteroidota bacterium]
MKINSMLQSMTGFAKMQFEVANKIIFLQIRSLNSKQLDINCKIPVVYREKELEIRSLIANKLIRGKIELAMLVENMGDDATYTLNKNLALRYYSEFKDLEKKLNEKPETNYLSLISRMPEVMKHQLQEIDEKEWLAIKENIILSLDELKAYRLEEGQALEKDIRQRVINIQHLLKTVEPNEKNRILALRKRIENELNTHFNETEKDKNRFEQELLYYVEKLDITEEKVRLQKHTEYFLELLDKGDSIGKKLAFVSQEIGREINTLGSKANDFELQQIVVNMKDELEKVKEQLLNIL